MTKLLPSVALIMSMEVADRVIIAGEEFTMGSYPSRLWKTEMFYLFRLDEKNWPEGKPMAADGPCVYVRHPGTEVAGMPKEALAELVASGQFIIS